MSHLPAQPYEIPWREVEHEAASERLDEEGRDHLGHLGRADGETWWGTETEEREARRDLLRRDRARRKLGGFGFRA